MRSAGLPHRLRGSGRDCGRHSLHDAGDEALIVHRVADAFAEVDVVERRLLIVHAEHMVAHGFVARDAHAFRLRHAVDLVGGQIGIGGMDVAAQQREHARRRLLDRLGANHSIGFLLSSQPKK